MLLIDQLAYSSAIRRLCPKYKLFLSCMSLLLCLLSRSYLVAAVTFTVMGALTLCWGKTSPTCYMKLLRVPLCFVVFSTMIIMINVTKEPIGIGSFQVGSYYLAITRESMSEAIRVFCVALASVSCMYFLTLSTPMIDILTALGQLHVPRLLIEMMLLLYRFIFLIFDMTNAITTAQKCRLSDINFKTKLTSMSKMLAATLIKSLQASNRLYDALESRGYTGTIEVIEPDYWLEKRQVVYAVVFELGVCLLACINWRMR